jgi:hypothetical protein
MERITVTLPAIDEQVIASLETLITETAATEAEALRAIREKYAPLARHNGFIRIAYASSGSANYLREDELFYKRDGKKVRGFLAADNFGKQNYHGDENRGQYTGSQLYLTEHGEWLRIKRDGHWSGKEGEWKHWDCGCSVDDSDNGGVERRDSTGSVEVLTDEEAAKAFTLAEILEQLAKSLITMAEQLPARMAKLQQRAALAGQLLAALR